MVANFSFGNVTSVTYLPLVNVKHSSLILMYWFLIVLQVEFDETVHFLTGFGILV